MYFNTYSTEIIPQGPTDSKSSVVQVMDWHLKETTVLM